MDNIPNEFRVFTKNTGSTGGGGGVVFSGTNFDSFGRLRVSNPVTLFDSQNRYKENEKFYSNVLNGGTVTYLVDESSVLLNVSTTLNSYAARESRLVFNYQPGKSLLIIITFVMNTPKTGLIQRAGYFGSDNGYFVQLNGSSLSIVERSVRVDTPVLQSNWNVDRLDGTGPSRFVLDMTKSQIFFMDIEWLGMGSVRTGFVIDGSFVPCHVFHHANYIPRTYMTTACLPIRYEILNTDGSSGTLKHVCSSVISEGGYEPKEQLYCFNGPYTGKVLGATGVLVPLVSIRLSPGRLDSIVNLKQINIAVSTNNDLAEWRLVLNATTLGGATWAGSTGGSTNVQVDTAATTVSGGRVIETGYAQTGSINTSLQPSFFDAHIGRNSFTQTSDTLTLCAIPLSADPKVFWSFAWAELI
jgi:hypothetical protein